MRVLIVEDNVILAEGLKLLLAAAEIEVAGVHAEAASFLEAVVADPPDIAVVDVRLPPSFRDEGVRAALRARELHPELPVLLFSQYVEETYARELLSDGRGAVGYLLKDRVSRVDEFVDSLRRIAAGATVMDPEVVSQLMTRRRDPLAALTPREREVLALMAAGYANGEIAQRLVVTERAVLKHVGNIFAKLDLPVGDSGHRRVLAVLAHLGS
ncbi:two component transcriptional regulator, LuxR family [Saccharopolyspora kobensis]|uniref:Two component transcriptional regulator, LuxR family n=1 Tax=Saccharopolyspora kobensis TaxID=146035 RepID=A0A1H6EEB0_9PSEU|nr:response regulator transcription factor [Saccharopolyspora kobensis]SEG95214.1 two component transcriptional regulator, LuxR family [Saccharopolyspora kobensis]SFD58971.1 two component transcriptional regulator, LuxR family [Saccharopolyspora kobensis]